MELYRGVIADKERIAHTLLYITSSFNAQSDRLFYLETVYLKAIVRSISGTQILEKI